MVVVRTELSCSPLNCPLGLLLVENSIFVNCRTSYGTNCSELLCTTTTVVLRHHKL